MRLNYLLAMLWAATAHGQEYGSMAQCAGLYRKADGSFAGICEFHEFGKAHILVDYATGQVGSLFDLPDGRIGVSRAIGEKAVPAVAIIAHRDDHISLDGQPLDRIAVSRQLFTVSNGPVTLAGELAQTQECPKGVLLLIHGSGDAPRHAYDLWTNLFLSHGWAVVLYDKRGSGESSGDWHEANFVALASDARTVLGWARAQKELRGLKFGLWGASQAGWIIPAIAAEQLVDFAIMQAGAVTPVNDFIAQTLESELRAYDFTAEEIAKAQSYYALDVAVSLGTAQFATLQAAYQKAVADGAEWLLKAPDPPKSPDRKFIATISGFDAAEHWRKVRVPLLAIFGGKDHVVPADINRRRLEELLAAANNKQSQIVILAGDNHLNMIAPTGVLGEYAKLNRLDPEYLETISKFLDRMSTRARSAAQQ